MCNRIRSQLQRVEYMLLIIVLLLTETADKTWHISFNVKICINIKEFKIIIIFLGEFI